MATAPTIQTQLGQLEGLAAWGGYLAADMLTIQFGKERTVDLRRGPTDVGQFALHIQNPWRIAKKGRTVVEQQDYYAADGIDAVHAVWDTVGRLLPDELPVNENTPKVSNVIVESQAGFLLTLDNGVSIQVFPYVDDPGDTSEAWRIIERDTDNRHFVVLSDGSIKV